MERPAEQFLVLPYLQDAIYWLLILTVWRKVIFCAQAACSCVEQLRLLKRLSLTYKPFRRCYLYSEGDPPMNRPEELAWSAPACRAPDAHSCAAVTVLPSVTDSSF